jgi:hypothetical protein
MAWSLGLAACGADRSAGPNYSTTPCSQNCGNDTQCQARCIDVSDPNGPPPFTNKR